MGKCKGFNEMTYERLVDFFEYQRSFGGFDWSGDDKMLARKISNYLSDRARSESMPIKGVFSFS